MTQEKKDKATERSKAWRLANPERYAQNHKQYQEKNRALLAEKARRYREANPEKRKAQGQRYYEANKPKWEARQQDVAIQTRRKALQKARYAKDPEAMREKARAYREANRDHIRERARARGYAKTYREKHPETAKRSQSRYRKANPDVLREYKNRRRAGADVPISSTEIREILGGTLGLCSYCNERRPPTLDHIEPLKGGGTHTTDNLAVACPTCNSSKGTTPLLVWMAKQNNTAAAAVVGQRIREMEGR